jgi:hypothetical protein
MGLRKKTINFMQENIGFGRNSKIILHSKSYNVTDKPEASIMGSC